MGPLPWTVNAEIYPLWARSMGSGMGAMTGWFCNLIIAVSFLSFVELIQNYGKNDKCLFLLSFLKWMLANILLLISV